MGFREAKSKVIKCLEQGNVNHDQDRGNINIKNLLATGTVSIDDVKSIILRARGGDYSCRQHHFNTKIPVHIIKTVNSGKSWYVKWYFLEPDAVFMSVHN